MSEVKFSKGSEEWMMFQDFWKLCQKYWETEDNDEYWEKFVDETNDFINKYYSIEMARKIAVAFLDSQENKFMKRRKK